MKRNRQRPDRARSFVVGAAFVAACALFLIFARGGAADEPPGAAELKKGEYARAVEILSARLAANPSDAEAQKNLLRAYIETGRYAETESSARKFLERRPEAAAVRQELAEALAATGRQTEAIAELERATRIDSPTRANDFERLAADLRRAELLEETGEEVRAREIFQTFVTFYEEKSPEAARELTLVARALARLGRYRDANDLYLEAISADPEYIEAQLGAGELFTEKYNYAEAAEFFRDALSTNPNSARAYLGIAANKRLEGGPEMTAALRRALEINPNLTAARALKAELELEAGEYDAAASELDAALKTNPRSAQAYALRAAHAYLLDRDYEPFVRQALAVNPRYGALYETLSHFATITRRSHQAAEFSRKAIELSPRLWRAHLSLGMALLRTGRMDEGRAAVEKAFEGDPFNVWAKNTLDLLDRMKEFRETKRGAFVIKADAKEHDVLAPYAADLLEEAAAKLTAKYRFTPQTPVFVELFPDHEDFAVRALGLPGLGALGVCFGPVIAQDSPSARPEGQFNWGSTLWHEYTHVITLQMTDYRIPRWFSEGLSVYEERRARPGWGDDWNPSVLRAHADGRWFKIADLDAGFMRPKRPDDISLAYFQASQVVEFITERHGFDAILKMLALYRERVRTPEVLRQALKMTEADFDRAFGEYVNAKANALQQAFGAEGAPVAQLPKEVVLKQLSERETFPLHMRAAAIYKADGDTKSAARHYRRAAELFAFYTGPGNAYESLAEILEKDGDAAGAADALELLIRLDETNLNALKRLAELRLRQGDHARALDALQLGFFVSPFDSQAHARAGELRLARNEAAPALAEFRAALATGPPNEAEAHYNIARAHHSLGQRAEAKRAVLRALEAAPSYEKAQELLLTITGQ